MISITGNDNISFMRGESLMLIMTLTKDGSAINLADDTHIGYAAWYTLKKALPENSPSPDYEESDADIAVQVSTEDDPALITTKDAATGKVQIHVPGEETDKLTPGSKYLGEFRVRWPTGETRIFPLHVLTPGRSLVRSTPD
jgi:hypothetical protein